MRRLSVRQFISLCSVQVQTRSGRHLLGALKSVPWNRVVKRWNTYGRNKRWRVQQTEFPGTGETFFLGTSKKTNRTLISGTRQQGRKRNWVQKQDISWFWERIQLRRNHRLVFGKLTLAVISECFLVTKHTEHQGFKPKRSRNCLKFVKNDQRHFSHVACHNYKS